MRTLLLAVCLLVLVAPSASGRWAEFLPAFSTVDEDLALLRADGALPDLPATLHPLARTDVAEALARAVLLRPELAADPVYRRLEREFAREVAELPASVPPPPDAPRETPPLIEWDADPHAMLRASAYASALLRVSPDSTTEVLPGSRVGARLFLRIAPGFVVHEDWTMGRVQNARRFGDYILGIRDLASDLPRAYASAAVGSARIQIGRDAARWGPGLGGTLLLSDASGSATVIAGSATMWRSLTLAARTHVLSAERGRYLAAHAIEWRASPRLTLALSEAAAYVSHGPEPLYLVGFIPYTMVQRQASEDSGDSLNAVLRNNLMACIDALWRPAPGWELRAQLLVDDVQLSSTTTPNRGGVQAGLTRTMRVAGTQRASLRAEYTRVTASTYAVWYSEQGDRDFVFHDRPLGFTLGPDAEFALLRAEWDRSRAVRVEARLEQTRTGAGGLVQPWTPGEPADQAWHMREPVERRRSIVCLARVEPSDVVRLHGAIGALWVANDGHVQDRTRRGVTGWIAAEVRR